MATTGLKSGIYLKDKTYRIERILGQGSFGITYLATAKLTTEGNLGKMVVEAKVAIKEFFMSEVNSRKDDGSAVDGSSGSVFSNYRKKFRKEAENLAKLSSNNIVRVIDVFDENSTTYYVMEFLEGENLDDYIRTKGAITEDEALQIVKEIGNALIYMHSQKMLHLDLKPKNIMRRKDGSICLIDFGLSKQFTDGGEPESSTSIGLGTAGYAPIEQASYKQDGTFPATLDVYALGATLFKMLTGSRPPEATTILNEGFPEEEIKGRGISLNTIEALKKAMHPMRRQRTQSIAAFIDSLSNSEADDATIIEKEPTQEEQKTAESVKAKDGTSPDIPEPSEPSLDSEKRSRKNSIKESIKILVIILFSALLVGLLVWLIRTHSSSGSVGVNDTVAYEDTVAYPVVEQKVIQTVTDMKWESPLGAAIYTGEVVPDTIEGGRNVIPHGKGKAQITDGEYAGNTYDGEFQYGKMEGRTLYTRKNGDTFVGRFKDNKYDQGRYKIKATGEYYDGTFRNGETYKGNWYDKNGNKL